MSRIARGVAAVQPAFAAIGAFISETWNNVLKPVLSFLWSFIKNVLGPAVLFLWRGIVQPAFSSGSMLQAGGFDRLLVPGTIEFVTP